MGSTGMTNAAVEIQPQDKTIATPLADIEGDMEAAWLLWLY
jgi:hypothetical protein